MFKRLDVLIAAVAAATVIVQPVRAGTCPGDADGDGETGFSDLIEVLSTWGPCPGCPADFDGNDVVEFDDLLVVLSTWGPCPSDGFTALELAGRPLSGYPHFQYIRTFNELDPPYVTVDPALHPETTGTAGLLWVVAARTAAEWDADPSLADVRGAPAGVVIPGPDINGNTSVVTGFLNGDGGLLMGVGYDIVLDLDVDGQLSAGDLIDGYSDEPGFYVVTDPTTSGPLGWVQTQYSGGSFLGQRTYYPDSIGTMGELPLVIISHGNGHQYTWYDYLGRHLATWGYVVMSHQNNTQPGIETASTTTLTNTDYILGHLGTIADGALEGHVDSSRIIWVGHSRGGEGVVRAYDRLVDGTYHATHFTEDDIVLISSIAPTDFLGANSANPHGVTYNLVYGAADGDVSGQPDCNVCQSFHLLERATGARSSTYVHGADHNDFNCCGFNDFEGPASSEIGRPEAQLVAKGAYLALLEHVLDGSLAAEDFLSRQKEDLAPTSVAATTVVDREYKLGPDSGKFVIDDFQTQSSTSVSSSGGAVTYDVLHLVENRMDDSNNVFTWTSSDPMNGMTRGNGNDSTRGIVFDWTDDSNLEFEISPGSRDLTGQQFLSLRACQGTRHPNTVVGSGDLKFTVTLRDGAGVSSSIPLAVYRGGVEKPYARSGSGSGTGWQNEFETIRLRLTDFLAAGSGLDLGDIEAVRLEFGPSAGTAQGRLGLDDVEVTK